MATTRWATAAATTLAVTSLTVLATAVTLPASLTSRMLALGVAVTVAAAAREATRDDVLGWTAVTAVSALTLSVVVIPVVLGVAAYTTSRPDAVSVILAASSILGLTAAVGRAAQVYGPWRHRHS